MQECYVYRKLKDYKLSDIKKIRSANSLYLPYMLMRIYYENIKERVEGLPREIRKRTRKIDS